MRILFTFRILLTIALFSIFQVQARWATREDAAIIREYFISDMVIHKDGTYTETYEFQDLIAKDYARGYAAGYTLFYNKSISKLTILSAKTTLNGVEYKVPKSKIEDKPLASSPSGFDQTHQVLISFPKIEVGSKIYLKYRIDYEKVPTPGAFTAPYFFGSGVVATVAGAARTVLTYWEKAHMDIHSKVPLYFKINDPDQALRITKGGTQPAHSLSIDLMKPLIKDTVNEPEESILNPKYQCWVSISSFANWGQLASKFSAEYATVINQSLPKKLRNILEEASKKEGEVAQINEVTSRLISQVQYMGDWKSIKGRFIPRPLKVIDKTGVGDCKDFTACTGAILKNMGYEVYPAWVWRGDNPPAEDGLPTTYSINHALLKVKGKEGRIYWIDPTNFGSMAQGVFPDVAGKMALVLDPNNPRYERIPEVSPASAQLEEETIMFIKDENVLEVSTNYIMRGEVALPLCGAELNLSLQNIAEQLFYSLVKTHLQPHEKKSLELPDLKSRIVKELVFKFVYDHPNGVYKSNRGIGMLLKEESLDSIVKAAPDQVNDLLISIPYKKIIKRHIKNGPIVNIEKLNYSIKTPWIEVERVCQNKGKASEILTTISVLKRYIPAEDLKSEAYKDLKKSLEWNMKDVIIILDEDRVS